MDLPGRRGVGLVVVAAVVAGLPFCKRHTVPSPDYPRSHLHVSSDSLMEVGRGVCIDYQLFDRHPGNS